ncbi:MAG: hypothetical protein SOZ01_03115 [Selenomonadaceae bacterium]|nr:hypothetical protein [Selenomonadaceae bacterium]MDY3915719.1 hypothetical protein [Selenomonadaceae bacterium]
MTAHIFFKSSSRVAKVHGVTVIRKYGINAQVKDVADCKDFVLEPTSKYTFIGDEIASFEGSEILYVEFFNR